ncbi:MAG: hypothetical protein A2Y98_02795 [Candidatus Portnoybacteria bacterium RBG_19FT_COMBO_36_7]|uniref:Uncharacterized protein n=1 Tax=Candidatus Portnoybacteria bacterium RBG_19FT_COMBO_36_7 TaxID=1801992 RepID=A0A1G2FAS9_9BACT|nr:MAG: hypothetical protein A2Y98_02795 [Candidatus Portnoybacteria bacterium RBG_19FT_COMBO_36_7]
MSKQKTVYLVLLALAVVFSLIGWFSLKGVLFNGSATFGVTIVALMFLLLGVALGLIAILFDSLALMILAPAASVAASFLFFGIKPAYIIIFVIGIGLIVFAFSRSLREKRARMKISPLRIAKPVLGAVFTFLALIISAIIYFSPPAQGISIEIKVPRILFSFVLSSMKNVAPSKLISFDQILDNETEESLYQNINDQVNFFLQPYKSYLSYGLAIAVFLSLKAASIIFVWLAIAIIQTVFVLMKKFNLVKIKKETIEKDILEI